MGRPLRIKAPDLTYHITSRTNGRRLFMKRKADQKMLCKCLNRILLKHGVTIYSYTPMINHFHMLIRIENEADLSKVMCQFKVLYAKLFNKKYNLSGHFWGDRFKSCIVQDDQYALACLRYIDRNAVKAGLVDHPGKWYLTTFNSYAYGQTHPILQLKPHPSYLAQASNRTKRRAFYLSFVIREDELSDELHGKLHRLQIFGSAEFVEDVRKIA
jgi:putative transposase